MRRWYAHTRVKHELADQSQSKEAMSRQQPGNRQCPGIVCLCLPPPGCLIDRNGTCFSFAGRSAEGISWTIENVIAIAACISTYDELEHKEDGAVDMHNARFASCYFYGLRIQRDIRLN